MVFHRLSMLSFALIMFYSSVFCAAQNKGHKSDSDSHNHKNTELLDPSIPLFLRVKPAPVEVLKMFNEAGMSPNEHKMTRKENLLVKAAFEMLPSLHKQVLKEHLQSISFLDDMPNSALTSKIGPNASNRLYNITFRAAILKQNISEWLTEKECTCFDNKDKSRSVIILAGKLNAIFYVLLHEATHVIDGSLGLLAESDVAQNTAYTSFSCDFTKDIWKDRTTLLFTSGDPLFSKNHFRRDGQLFSLDQACDLYRSLKMTPFVSLYSSSSRHEDLAEFLTIYHLTQNLKQPFTIIVFENGKQTMAYKPMSSDLVKKRIQYLSIFYFQKSKV